MVDSYFLLLAVAYTVAGFGFVNICEKVLPNRPKIIAFAIWPVILMLLAFMDTED